ncbi:MAG: hypothetical protein GC153_07505 [Alphaproteobacteria bacterium]|nr:hypothetical protein [Alphaproteobacteria bacterium]
MKTRAPYELAVIGADAAGLAAAACAARAGARVALVGAPAPARPKGATSPSVPDFVWRRLDLQDSGLQLQPVEAYVSLFEDGKSLATYASSSKTRAALEREGVGDFRLWTDFQLALTALWKEGGEMARRASINGARANAHPLLTALSAPSGERLAQKLAATTAGLLDDFFTSEELKVHLANIALSPFGLGGDETGSALAVASLSDAAGWRSRARRRAPSLEIALEDVAKAAGVEFFSQKILDIRADEKLAKLSLDSGEALKARRVMASSEAAAAAAGLKIAHGLAPLARREGAQADIRLKFSKAPPPPAAGKHAVFFLADSIASISEARDAVLEGRLPERPPISFEFVKDEIIVRAPYCPAVLRTEGESREWTEQDRQALGRQIVARLAPYLNGAVRNIRRIEVSVSPAGAPKGDAGAVAAPPPGHDVVGAAARLALDLVSGD